MKASLYLASWRLAIVAALLASAASSCRSVLGEGADPVQVAKIESKLEEVQKVADAAATASAASPGLGSVAGIAALISGVAGAALSYYRNQTRKSDPAVANALAQPNGSST